MLTPSFDIEQNDQFVILTIRVPYIKISEAEFYINGTEFKFYCKPYFLRLHLPGELVDDDRQKACYDVDKGTIVAYLPKLRPGQHFENLGMITSLLSKKPAKNVRKFGASPRIDEVTTCNGTSGGDGGDGGNSSDGGDGDEIGEESDEFDWEIEQQLTTDENDATMTLSPSQNRYGFASHHSGVFVKLQEEIPSIVDCPDPDHMTSHERRVGRIAHEEASFDAEHYLADLMDNDAIDGLLKYEPPWRVELVKWREKQSSLLSSTASAAVPSSMVEPGQDIVSFTAEERDTLKELPNRDFLLDKATRRSLYLGLIDIIFAFAYDNRTTLGENSVESAWNICKVSSTLSWLEVFRGGVHEVLYCCLRRSLSYPLFRHWQLALTVLQDTRDIFRLGRRKVLQCLLAVRQLLNSSEPYYILNNLYITEYCVWIQRASAKKIQSLADELDEVKVDKSTVGWDLLELEEAARLVIEEENQRDKDEVDSQRDRDEGERVAMTGHQPGDATLEQLTSKLEKIALSPQRSAEDCPPPRTDLSTEIDQRLNDPTLVESSETQAQDEDELTEIRLSCSAASDSKEKPLIEEIGKQDLSDSETTGSSCSTCSGSESDCDTSSEDEDDDSRHSADTTKT